jgi:exopolysaccharide biosynthesis protein
MNCQRAHHSFITAIRSRLVMLLTALVLVLPTTSTTHANAASFNWITISNGIQYAVVTGIGSGKQQYKDAVVVRIDPSAVLFRVYYEPKQRKTVQQWAAKQPSAQLIINASFFRGNGQSIGLIQLGNKIVRPASRRADSGQFTVLGEIPTIKPLQPDELVTDATVYGESLEGHPLLVWQGQPHYQPLERDEQARRSVLAQDSSGFIYVINTAAAAATLNEMIDWLINTPLGIVSALNLDGGISSQIYFASPLVPRHFSGGAVRVPVVLAVYPR